MSLAFGAAAVHCVAHSVKSLWRCLRSVRCAVQIVLPLTAHVPLRASFPPFAVSNTHQHRFLGARQLQCIAAHASRAGSRRGSAEDQRRANVRKCTLLQNSALGPRPQRPPPLLPCTATQGTSTLPRCQPFSFGKPVFIFHERLFQRSQIAAAKRAQ